MECCSKRHSQPLYCAISQQQRLKHRTCNSLHPTPHPTPTPLVIQHIALKFIIYGMDEALMAKRPFPRGLFSCDWMWLASPMEQLLYAMGSTCVGFVFFWHHPSDLESLSLMVYKHGLGVAVCGLSGSKTTLNPINFMNLQLKYITWIAEPLVEGVGVEGFTSHTLDALWWVIDANIQ